MNDERVKTEIIVKFEKLPGRRIFLFRESGSLSLIGVADFSADVWRSVFPIVLKRAAEDTKELIRRAERYRRDAAVLLKPCDAVLALMNFGRMVHNLNPAYARQVARAWQSLPVTQRVYGFFNCNDVRAVHVQLRGRSRWHSANVLSDDVHPSLPEYIRALDITYRTRGPYWLYSRTPLGVTCVAFETRDPHDLVASAVISNCRVDYRRSCDDRWLKQKAAIMSLADEFPEVVGDKDALSAAGWEPSGHDLIELSDYLAELKQRACEEPSPHS